MADEVLIEGRAERARQDAKWGEQNHPSVTGWSPELRAHRYKIPTEPDARHMCEESFANGLGTYAHIALEEFCEAVGAADDVARRGELVQLAAVVVAWIESIDRRLAKGGE